MSNYSDNKPSLPKLARLAFGILMVCVYVGIGLLFILKSDLLFKNETTSYAFGALLCIYGVWRGYRLYSGMK